jgi:ABC-type transport system substrate-binding protein
VLRRAGVALAAAIAVSTVASTASAASKPQAGKYGGAAKVATGDNFAGWCFADNNANSALMAQRTVYETLFEKTRGGDLVGLLAQSASSSSDLKTWTITLRDGVLFHDGTKMTASVVKKNLDYGAGFNSSQLALAGAQKKAAWAASAYTKLKGLGATGTAILAAVKANSGKAETDIQTLALTAAIGGFADDGGLDKALSPDKETKGTLKKLGLDELPDLAWFASTFQLSTATAFIGNINKVTADDAARTVTLSLNRAQNDVPSMLYASGRFFIRGEAQITGTGTRCSSGRPIGTGPFMTAENYTFAPGDLTLEVTKNKSYWRKDAKTGEQLPYLDKITFTTVKEPLSRALAVRRGTSDAAYFGSSTDATFIKDLRRRKSVVTEFRSPYEYFPTVFLNQTRVGSPFGSENARLAVLNCIDSAGFVKARTKGENRIATSIVGPTSIMHTRSGFQKFNVKKSAEFLAKWKAENPAKNTELSFTFVRDTSSQAKANADFFVRQWAKCGIKANVDEKDSALGIKLTFNSSKTDPREQNAYDLTFAQLYEGDDVSFNLPFTVSNMIQDSAANIGTNYLWRSTVGSVLSLNHHTDAALDKIFFDANGNPNARAAKLKYQEGTAYMQSKGYMGAVSWNYFSMFFNKKSGLTNIGKVQIEKNKTQRVITNWGIDWSGVQLVK